MSGPAVVSTVTLRALSGAPLADETVRNMVVATATAIGERQGVAVLRTHPTATSITVTLGCGRIEAIGFAAELRRLSTNWYRHKFGAASLWGQARRGEVAGGTDDAP